MSKRSHEDNIRTNDELARRLFQRDSRTPPTTSKPASSTAEPMASRREPFDAPQTWSLGGSASHLDPVDERERRALFAALSKGSKANLGREPTVAELVRLVEEVDRARALVKSSQDAIQGRISVFIEDGRLAFRGSMASVVQVQKDGKREGVA